MGKIYPLVGRASVEKISELKRLCGICLISGNAKNTKFKVLTFSWASNFLGIEHSVAEPLIFE